jgi:hypothetical protein
MPLDEGIEEVVTILSHYYSDRKRFLQEQYGDQAVNMAEEMGEMVGELLQGETPFSALWPEYMEDPDSHEAELIGALEMLEESMPEVTIRLEGYYAAFVEMQKAQGDVLETSEPEDLVNIEEIEMIKSYDDGDNDDEYREETTYLTGNVEDHSTSAMYYEDQDTSIEPNQTEED